MSLNTVEAYNNAEAVSFQYYPTEPHNS